MSRPTDTSIEAQLRYVYEDVSRISQIASDDVILHSADRDITPNRQPIRGKAAVAEYLGNFLALTRGTLKMEVESISTNADFGAVLGVIHAGPIFVASERIHKSGGVKVEKVEYPELAVSFCGLWRFVDGIAVEHWENTSEPRRFVDWLVGASSLPSSS